MSFVFNTKNLRFGIFLWLLAIGYLLSASSVYSATFSKPPSNLGLVGYWSFDEGTSTIAHDFSGFAQNGTLTNMDSNTDWIAGKRGKALDFDGVNDHVSIADPSGRLNLTGNMTISMWVRDSDWDEGDLLSKAAGSYAFWVQAGSAVRFGKQNGSASSWAIGPLPPTNEWVHIVGVSNGSQVFIYHNGVLKASSSGAPSFSGNAGNLAIGAGVGTGDDGYVSAQIDDVRIYNRAFTIGEIQSLYSSGQVTRKVVSNRGLVGHWSLDEGTSTIAHDFSGNSHHGTLTSMDPHTDWTGGKRGKALDFDGSNDFIALGNPTALNIVGQVAISAWVNFSSFPTSNNCGGSYCGVIFEKGYDGSVEGYSLRYNSPGGVPTLQVLSYSGAGTNDTSWTINFPINTWHHIVGLHNGTQWKLYVDGVNVATRNDNDGALSSTANAAIGGAYISGVPERFFPGKIDDVRVYNRALSDAEILTLYSQNQTAINSSQKDRLTNGLVGYWSFNGSDISWANNLAYDRSGGNNHGAITNMSTSTSPVPGQSGQALNFDQIDDYILARNESNFDFDSANPFSISVWVKYVANSSTYSIVTKQQNGGNFPGIDFSIDTTNQKLRMFIVGTDGSTINYTTANNSILSGIWQHAVVTYNGNSSNSGVQMYINGVALGSGSGSLTASPLNNQSLTIGDNFAAGGARFKGIMDELRVYNRALSADEAKQLYRLGR